MTSYNAGAVTRDPYDYDTHASIVFPPVFAALRTLARSRKIWVGVQVWFGRGEPRAEFVTKATRRGGEPRIMVRTPGGPNRVNDLVDSMILAHEMGHHQSHVRREATPAVEELTATEPERIFRDPLGLPLKLRYEIVAEEVRAWNYARDDLRECGFSRWLFFERWARRAVESYVRSFRLRNAPDA